MSPTLPNLPSAVSPIRAIAIKDVISIEIPMTFKKRGGRKVIVLLDGSHGHPEPAATIDNTMIKSIARAFRWQRLLESQGS